MLRFLRIGTCLALTAVPAAWASAALYFDLPFHRLNIVAAIAYLALVLALSLFTRLPARRLLACTLAFTSVLIWWLHIPPSNAGPWQPDVSHLAYADRSGSNITFHNVRVCDYKAEFNYSCQWITRQVPLDCIEGADLFMDYWGSPWIAHTLVSFDLAASCSEHNDQHLVFSIEARKRPGQSYSSIRGFFRQYTLVSIVSEERDVIRLRTNYRHGEDVYLYHTKATPQFARDLLLDYAHFTNQLHQTPQWYNAITHNCTTEIFTLDAMRQRPWDWRILLNGKADEMLYNQGELATELPGQPANSPPLPFSDLKRLAYINPKARTAGDSSDFSTLIRQNRPGFAP